MSKEPAAAVAVEGGGEASGEDREEDRVEAGALGEDREADRVETLSASQVEASEGLIAEPTSSPKDATSNVGDRVEMSSVGMDAVAEEEAPEVSVVVDSEDDGSAGVDLEDNGGGMIIDDT